MYIITSVKVDNIPVHLSSCINKKVLLEELVEEWSKMGSTLHIKKTHDGLLVYEKGLLNVKVEFELTREKFN